MKMKEMRNGELQCGRNRHLVGVKETPRLVVALDKGNGHAADMNNACDSKPVF